MTLQTRLVGSSRRRIEFNPGTIGCSHFGDLITLSALYSTDWVIVSPICFAVLRVCLFQAPPLSAVSLRK